MKKFLIILLSCLSLSGYSQFMGVLGGGQGEASTLYNDLVAAWGLNEASGTIYDYTTNNYDGTATNTPTYGVAGKVGDAISFAEASDEYIDFGTSFWNPGTSDVTVAGWVNTAATSNDGGIVGNWGTHPYWYIRLASSGDYLKGIVNFSGANIETQSNSTLSDATWYHFIYQLDRDGNASLYLNNVLQTDTDDISGSVAVSIANSNTHAIGRAGNDLAGYYHNGTIDAVQIWSRLLTSDERAENYNSGNGWEP